MSTNTLIKDKLTRHQAFLLRYSGAISKDVDKLIKKLRKEINKKLKQDNTDFRTQNLIRLNKDLDAIVKKHNVGKKIEDNLKEFAASEIKYMEGLLDVSTSADIVKTSPELIYSTLSKNKMVLTSTTGVETKLTLKKMVKNFDKDASKKILSAIRFGVLEGQTIDQITRAVDSKSKMTRRQARSLVRTATNFIGGEARSVVMKANKEFIKKEEYVATLDSRTTILCAGLDGKKFKVGKGPHPPLHWGCRSLRSPFIDPKYGLSGLKGERGEVTINKEGKAVRGTVKGDTKYAGWLRQQPKEFQNEMLGEERAKLFRSGKVKLDKFVDENYKVMTLKELENT